jgi:hypothetical protein
LNQHLLFLLRRFPKAEFCENFGIGEHSNHELNDGSEKTAKQQFVKEKKKTVLKEGGRNGNIGGEKRNMNDFGMLAGPS